ncbi:MAG TPA: hypothetical protein VNI82_00335 [Candidatus Nitrosotenuis sp.]|nr:hypothetical protein [Candidatus Nitrosotenuis sp.]
MHVLIEIIGLLGAALLLFAYFQTSRGAWKGTSAQFQWFNIAASVCLVVYSGYKFAYANILLNTVWLVIGSLAVYRLSMTKKR